MKRIWFFENHGKGVCNCHGKIFMPYAAPIPCFPPRSTYRMEILGRPKLILSRTCPLLMSRYLKFITSNLYHHHLVIGESSLGSLQLPGIIPTSNVRHL